MHFRLSVCVAAFSLFFPVHASSADPTDALIVLATIGFLTGAADVCKVAPEESNVAASALAIAIGSGNYGDPAEAQTTFNTARQRGIASASAKKVDCAKIGEHLRNFVKESLQE
jgi:hypothetical protein